MRARMPPPSWGGCSDTRTLLVTAAYIGIVIVLCSTYRYLYIYRMCLGIGTLQQQYVTKSKNTRPPPPDALDRYKYYIMADISATTPTPTATPERITTGTVIYELCATATRRRCTWGAREFHRCVSKSLPRRRRVSLASAHSHTHNVCVIYVCDSVCVCAFDIKHYIIFTLPPSSDVQPSRTRYAVR